MKEEIKRAKIRKKKSALKKYLIEFVLVFAAIALGFFAENLREYYADKAKEKEFIKSLVENLYVDSMTYAKRDSSLKERIVWMDTLTSLLTSKQKNRNAEMYLLGRYSTRTIQFRPGLSTLNFLSKSNEYSSTENNEVKKSIQEYESNLNWLQKLFDLDEEMSVGLYPHVSKIFDVKVYLKMTQFGYGQQSFTKPNGNPKLLGNDPIDINQLVYRLYVRRSQFYSQLIYQKQFNLGRQKLIAFLSEKYHLSPAN
jgi:hypothetical protein